MWPRHGRPRIAHTTALALPCAPRQKTAEALPRAPASPAAAGWPGSKRAGKTGLFQEGSGIAMETVSRTGRVDGCAVVIAARVRPAGVVRAWGIAGDCRSTTARAQNIVITSVRAEATQDPLRARCEKHRGSNTGRSMRGKSQSGQQESWYKGNQRKSGQSGTRLIGPLC